MKNKILLSVIAAVLLCGCAKDSAAEVSPVSETSVLTSYEISAETEERGEDKTETHAAESELTSAFIPEDTVEEAVETVLLTSPEPAADGEDGYPRFKCDKVTRITVIPEFQIPMGKEPLEAPDWIMQDIAKLIDVYEAERTDKPAEELTGGGYIVTVYDTEGKFIEYNFWNEEIFVVDGIYYRFAERAYGENIIDDIVAVIREAEVNAAFGEIILPEITPLSQEEDIQIRTDYAAYVSSRHKTDDGASGTPRLLTADDVLGEYYFGTADGYKLLVMCPSWCYTDDLGVCRLRYTDADIIDPSCDCYPYIDVELPSGMFELLAYKDGTFIPVEEALETKLIDYSAAKIIGDYMDALYNGNRECVYARS